MLGVVYLTKYFAVYSTGWEKCTLFLFHPTCILLPNSLLCFVIGNTVKSSLGYPMCVCVILRYCMVHVCGIVSY